MITGIVAFVLLGPLSRVVELFFDTATNAVMGLALFHTLFNLIGAIIFLPFIGYMARFFLRVFPERKAVLTVMARL
ncbi:MAG: hypothetical protein D3903_09020 [Candidatus Electrothrix sp. GM3_4]|nr:hypothetical protein [Candidatus Electrothrix sp. GM3_4]